MSSPHGFAYGPRIRLEAIGEAWQFFTREMGVWVPAALIATILQHSMFAALGLAFGAPLGLKLDLWQERFIELSLQFIALQVAIGLVCNLFNYVIWGGLYQMAIKQIRGERIELGDMFLGFRRLPQLVGAYLLVTLLVTAGMITCLLPGLIMAGLLMLAVPIIMDQGVGVTRAMEMSFGALKKEWILAPFFWVVLHIVSMIGFLACGVGLFFTMPLLFLTTAILYRDCFLGQAVPTYAPPPPYQMGR